MVSSVAVLTVAFASLALPATCFTPSPLQLSTRIGLPRAATFAERQAPAASLRMQMGLKPPGGKEDEKLAAPQAGQAESSQYKEDVEKFGFEFALLKNIKDNKGAAKQLFKEYAGIYLGVTVVLSGGWFAACYALVSQGNLDPSFLEQFGVTVDPQKLSVGVNIGVAYALYKVMMPLRL
eukprot:CAMPEP_0174917934 /NCGR_PEP_ID=MMETSP1355-20121228/2793_1 /TAXON_ID=464990 /ORGANISM="Hemiselmis tepida, Strain CCMP443" /LENGTH=178 /DNA_ID=CAMNT_0016163083 /DNA_START=60 /DNA_END=593 /DNA_ORIENTATION=+